MAENKKLSSSELEEILLANLTPATDMVERDGRDYRITKIEGKFVYDEAGGETHFKDITCFMLLRDKYVIALDRSAYLESAEDEEHE